MKRQRVRDRDHGRIGLREQRPLIEERLITTVLRRLVLGVTALGLIGATSIRADAGIVINGSFEDVQIGYPFQSSNPANVPGWTHTGTAGDSLLVAIGYADSRGSVGIAGDGKQFVIMGGGFAVGIAHWDQTLTGLTPGASYGLTFKMAAEANFSGAQSLTVDFPTGSSTGPQTFTAATPPVNYWSDWESKSMTFVATASSVDLRFTGGTLTAGTQYDVGLDSVNVTQASAVPEPSTLATGGTALLLCLGALGWRRRPVPKGSHRR